MSRRDESGPPIFTGPPMSDRQPTTDPADEQPWDEAGCSRRSCKDGHSHEMGRCAYGVEPPPTLARWKTFTASDGCLSIGTETLSAEQVADWLRGQGYTVAPKVAFPHKGMTAEQVAEWRKAVARASEAPGDAHSPTPDAGAVRGGEVGSAAESEPRPVDLAFAALGRWFHNTTPGAEYTYTGHTDDPADCGICWEAAEKATEAVIPAIRAAERAQVADEIEAGFGEDAYDSPSAIEVVRDIVRRLRGDQ